MRSEEEIKGQLRYWEGRLDGLLEGTKGAESEQKAKGKVPAQAWTHPAVEKTTAEGWVNALRWVLGTEGKQVES